MFSAGGVILINDAKRITVNNTLDERLRLLEDRVRLPLDYLFPDVINNTHTRFRCFLKLGKTSLV